MTQRLIGAIVLVGLLVIFLPMLLNDRRPPPVNQSPATAETEFNSRITPLDTPSTALQTTPPAPDGEAEVELKSPPDDFLTTPAELRPRASLEEDGSPAETQDEPAAEKVDASVKPAKPAAPVAKTAVLPIKSAAEAAKAASAKATAPAKPVTEIVRDMESGIKARTRVSGWVVQMGSFSNEQNAIKLRDRLRDRGYASFVDSPAAGDKRFQVRIGPQGTHARADEIRSTLEKEMQIKGIIKPYQSLEPAKSMQ